VFKGAIEEGETFSREKIYCVFFFSCSKKGRRYFGKARN